MIHWVIDDRVNAVFNRGIGRSDPFAVHEIAQSECTN